jgi:two-component system chemotaxis family response regulator WspR
MIDESGPENSEEAAVVPTNEYAMVLLVDDQVIVAEAIRRMLAGQEIDLHYCANPAEAIDVAGRVRPTVILQDLVMPGVDGLTLVRQYRAHRLTRDIPIIVLSSKEDPAVKREAFGAGANDYLIKPSDRIELVARIRHHSQARTNQLQKEEAHRALRESQRRLIDSNTALMALNQELQDAQGTRSAFLANVSLSFRAAMDDIMGMTTVLLETAPTKEQVDTIESIRRSCGGLLSIIDDLNNFSKVEADDFSDDAGAGIGAAL